MKPDKLNRRKFMKLTSAAAVMALPGLPSSAGTKVMRKPKTNVILIMADDIGYECFGCYGGTSHQTPNIDKLAAKGIRFSHCYSQPLCTPSRVKIMTGQSNIRNYNTFSILLPGEKTFGHMLQDHGYKTMVAGKWQLYGAEHYNDATRGTGTLPSDAGFDECCLWQVEELGGRYWGPKLNVNGVNTQYPNSDYGPDKCVDYIVDFIGQNKSQPFFVYYPMILPHNPFDPTPDSEDKNSSDKNKNFSDMTTYVDKLVGRIVKSLDDFGIQENTLVMFTGDNGTNTAITSQMGDDSIKGGKKKTTDAGTRVPFVATLSGSTPGGKVCDDLVDFSDFLPTIAQVTGAPLLQGVTLDGQSFLPQIMGKKGNPRESIFEYYNPRPTSAPNLETRFARDKRWKLYGNGQAGKNGQLYDVTNDVLEENPILADQDTPESQAARQKLQAVIDAMPAEALKIAE